MASKKPAELQEIIDELKGSLLRIRNSCERIQHEKRQNEIQLTDLLENHKELIGSALEYHEFKRAEHRIRYRIRYAQIRKSELLDEEEEVKKLIATYEGDLEKMNLVSK